MSELEIIKQISDATNEFDRYFRFPEAEAIVPANIHRVGAALGAEYGNLDDRFSLFTSNLQATYDSLDTAPNDQCYNDRLADVVSDTAIVNGMCELGGDPGAFVAGAIASKKADQYMDTSVKESLD